MEAEEQNFRELTEISLRVILGAVFIWAGTMKLLDIDSFVASVGHFKLAPFDEEPWDMWLGYMLPAFEVLVGTALILGILLRGAMLSTFTMSSSFLIAVVIAHSRGLNYECGCFGSALSFKNASLHISILSLMVIMAMILIILELKKNQNETSQDKQVKTY